MGYMGIWASVHKLLATSCKNIIGCDVKKCGGVLQLNANQGQLTERYKEMP